MMNLNLVNHPIMAYGGGRRSLGSRFKNMDYILLAAGIVVFIAATAISAAVNPYILEYGGEGFTDFTTYTTLICQAIGGVMAIAALAGKRVFM